MIFSNNFARIILGTSDAWTTSHLSKKTSKSACFIVDCRILSEQVHYELDPYELCTYLSYLT